MATPIKSNQQHIFLHDAICEGPIDGLVYGDSSVFLNNARMRDLSPDAAFRPLNGKVSASSTTFSTVGDSIPLVYLGVPKNDNYLVVRREGIDKTANSTATYTANTKTFAISGSGFTTDYDTVDDDSKLIALVDASNTVILLGEGDYVSSTSIKVTPFSPLAPYEIARIISADYNVQLVESLKITNISSSSITTATAPSLGNSSLGTPSTYYSFFISGSIEPDPEDLETDDPAKLTSSSVQFRVGSSIQDPIVELNGVGGGTPYPGDLGDITGGGANLKQLDVAGYNNSATTESWEEIYPTFTPYSTSYYPEGESITTEGATAPTIIPSSAFGLSGTTVKTVDELRIGISYNAFYVIDKSDGEEYNNNAAYLFQIRLKKPGASSFEDKWKNAFNDGTGNSVGQVYHTGKHKSAISFEHYLDLTAFKPFDDFQIRVVRLTRHKGRGIANNRADTGEDRQQGDATSAISVLTAINKDKFSYPYTAHAGVFLDSREFSSVPKRSYEIRGLKVRVPKNYIPREYSTTTGTGGVTIPVYPEFWDGTLSDELYYTDNPAWIFYDIVVNDRFGAGEWVKKENIDLYALYRVSKYCDELVENGRGSYEPRFRANLYLSKATDVYKVLKDMATIFTSLVYWMDGKMTTVLDAPADPIYQFTKANVIDGMFSYETSGQKTRINQVVVTWNDPALSYEQSALVVEDRAAIIAAGQIIKEDAMAFGCTSEGQARRYGKWKLWTAKAQTEVITFATSFEGLFIKPGDVIQVQDSDRYGRKISGRIKDITNTAATIDGSGNVTDDGSTEIELDRSITLNSTLDYELAVLITKPAGVYMGKSAVTVTTNAAGNNGGTYGTGDIITHAWIGESTATGTGRYHSAIDTPEKAANAYTDSSGGVHLSLNWTEESYVKTYDITETTGNHSSINTTESISLKADLPQNGSVWMLTEKSGSTPTAGSPDLYKVLSITQDQSNIYSITAVEWSLSKFSYVDDPDAVIDIEDDLYAAEPEAVVAPTQVRILQKSLASTAGEELVVEWDYPGVTTNSNGESIESGRFLDSFEIFTNIEDEDDVISIGKKTRRKTFNNVPDGEYVFRVRAISVSGNKSAWVTARYLVDDPFSDNVNRNKGLQLEGLASQFPFVTNESDSSGGQFRGAYDSTTGLYNFSTNPDGYRQGDIVLHLGNYKYLPSSGTHNLINTWEDYRGGILKFRHNVSAVLAPSRFRRSDAVSLASNFAFDVNIIRSDSWIGVTANNNRYAQVVLDHSTNSLRLIHARFDEALNMFYWYDLHEAMDENNTTEIQKYWTALSGTVSIAAGSNKVIGSGTSFTSFNNLNKFRFSSTFGARVSYIESDTVMYLDKRTDAAVTAGTTAYGQKYTPDFRKDVIIGRVSVPNSGRGSFTFENFLTLDPNLEGKRSLLIDSNVAFLQYDPDENLTLAPESISIEATSIGFDEPLFRVSYGDPSTAPLDENGSPTIFEPAQLTFQVPNLGIYGYSFNVWDGANPIPYDGGAAFTIKVEVVEKEDQGNTDKGVSQVLTIGKVGDVAAATGGRSVFMELEDYSVIYNSTGKKPVYNGQPNYSATPNAVGNILFSATASPGFGSPIFRWKVDGTAIVPDPTNYPNATWYEAGGGGDLATYDWPVPATLGDATNGFNWTTVNGGSKSVTVEVAEKPTGWTATVPGSGTNTNEVTDADIFAKDVDNILAIRVNAGGLAINFVNDSHIIPCDAEGVVLSSANSGGSIEVFMGGQGVDFTTSGTPIAGQFTIGSITSTESDKITVGTPSVTTQSSGPDIATIPDHTFTGTLDDTSNTGFETQEAITYPLTIYPHDGGDAITTSVTQVFTLVKNGAQAGTGVIYLYATGATVSDLTTIDSSFPTVRVNMADGSVNHSATTGFPTVFQDSDYGYYTSPTGASTVGQPGDVLWVIGATANSNGTDDFILYDEWTTPVQFSGTDGINSRVLELYASHDGEDVNGNPTPPALNMSDITYTFANGGLSYTTLGNWSETMPSPSRSTPYVWRTTAAALSNTATTVIDGKDSGSDVTTDWSNAVLMNRFVEDGITLELDNDAETVGAEEGSAVTGLSVVTTAKIFQGGADVSNQWDFNATLPANLTCNTKTSATDPVAGTGTNFNVFTVTRLESNYTSGNIQITASPKTGGTYDGAASRSINFTVTRLNNGEQGVSYRIIPSVTAVSYSAVTSSHTPSGAITFSAQKIDPDGTVTAQTGYWSQTGGGSDTINNTSASSSTTVTPNTGNNATNNITVDFYLSYDSSTSTLSNLVDRETVQITPDGNNGSAVDIWFARTSGTPTVTSVNSSGVPQGNVTWVTSVANTSGTTQLWAVVVKKAVNATTYTNDTPYKVNGTAVAEVYCFRKTTGGDALSTAPGDTAYNFTDATLV